VLTAAGGTLHAFCRGQCGVGAKLRPGRTRKIARAFVKRYGIEYTCLVDQINDRIQKLYNGFPNRIFVIDTDGTIAVRGKDSPMGVALSYRAVKDWLKQSAADRPSGDDTSSG